MSCVTPDYDRQGLTTIKTTPSIIMQSNNNNKTSTVRVVATFLNVQPTTTGTATAASPAMLETTVKASGSSFQELAGQLQAAFGIWKRQNLLVRYTDNEGDLLTLTNDAELQEALHQLLSHHKSGKEEEGATLRMFVSRKKQQKAVITRLNPAAVAEVVKERKNEQQAPVVDEEERKKLEELEKMGFTNAPQNKRLLSRFQGDLSQVQSHLQALHKREQGLAELQALGLGENKGRRIALLNRFHGDVGQVVAFLQDAEKQKQERLHRREQRLQRQAEKQKEKEQRKLQRQQLKEQRLAEKQKKEEEARKEEEPQVEAKQLVQDLPSPCTATADRLEGKKESSTEVTSSEDDSSSSSASSGTSTEEESCSSSSSEEDSEDSHPNKVDKEMAKALKTLEEQGFKRRRRNQRLLIMFDGDVDKVSAFLRSRREERKLLRQKMNALRDAGFHNRPQQNRRLLAKFGGDVDKVRAHLEEREAALHQLESMGFTRQGLNLRLLNKHDGDVGRVVEALLRREAKWQRKEEKQQWQQAREGMKQAWKAKKKLWKLENSARYGGWKTRKEEGRWHRGGGRHGCSECRCPCHHVPVVAPIKAE
ncbi:hypothetical protein QOT17_004816 [Balamuthia mandrillaris]